MPLDRWLGFSGLKLPRRPTPRPSGVSLNLDPKIRVGASLYAPLPAAPGVNRVAVPPAETRHAAYWKIPTPPNQTHTCTPTTQTSTKPSTACAATANPIFPTPTLLTVTATHHPRVPTPQHPHQMPHPSYPQPQRHPQPTPQKKRPAHWHSAAILVEGTPKAHPKMPETRTAPNR